jgi:hypothetical protein
VLKVHHFDGTQPKRLHPCVKFRYLNKSWSQTLLFTYAPSQLPHNPGGAFSRSR